MRGQPSILLVGYRGSGKTSVGRLLAARLGRKFFDTDEMIAQTAGQTIKEIFDSSGEAKFRELESAAVNLAVIIPSAVIALGGGALIREANRKAITSAGCRVVYLACTPEVLHERIQSDVRSKENRPNLTALGGSADEVRQLLSQREPTYRSMASAVVDVTMCSPAQAADEVLRVLGLQAKGLTN